MSLKLGPPAFNPSGPMKALGGRLGSALKSHAFSVGGMINLGFAVMEARGHMADNPRMGMGEAIGKTALNFALMEMIPGYMGAQILSEVGKVAGEMSYQGYRAAPFVGLQKAGHFEATMPTDNANMATMRQRSLAALGQSRMNARSVLGSEARLLHRNQVAL